MLPLRRQLTPLRRKADAGCKALGSKSPESSLRLRTWAERVSKAPRESLRMTPYVNRCSFYFVHVTNRMAVPKWASPSTRTRAKKWEKDGARLTAAENKGLDRAGLGPASWEHSPHGHYLGSHYLYWSSVQFDIFPGEPTVSLIAYLTSSFGPRGKVHVPRPPGVALGLCVSGA